ncbi:MAG: L-erythro-3,5-diaminohexanoate dehydrogenase [Firmicutes bacterium]|nr:L-erythro-3,5-diaminohexanoate dehydrogenase [Bacillota bacterium]
MIVAYNQGSKRRCFGVYKTGGCRYGSHRSIEPAGSLPQPAWKLDNSPAIWDNEILIAAETLNIDAASFRQMSREAGGDVEGIKKIILKTVAERGKQHNPVTGSGGMLIGRVADIGPELRGRDLAVGDRIATLVSLSLTPLKIDRILAVRPETCQVDVVGQAVLFASGIYAKMPADLPDKLALAVLDVAGAPAQTAKIVSPGATVLIIGAGGKSGLLCLHQARKRVGSAGRVIALDYAEAALDRVAQLEAADVIIQADATQPLAVLRKVEEATAGDLADVTINCVDVPGTEMASVLATRDGGLVYFFSMATSFTAAALGAEGVGKDVQMLIGNGYTAGHAQVALDCVRENDTLRELFTSLYA